MSPIVLVLAAGPLSAVLTEVRPFGGATVDQAGLVATTIAKAMPTEAFKVTTAGDLAAVLTAERQRELLGCSENSSECAVELANALGSDIMVLATLGKLDTNFSVSVAFIAGRTGTALARITADAPTVDGLLAKLPDEVSAAAAKVYAAQRPGEVLLPGTRGIRRWAWLPAAGGAALAVTAAILFAVTGNTWALLNSRTQSVDDPDALAQSGRSTQTAAWVLGSVGVAALVAAAGMFTFGAPVAPRIMVAPVASPAGAGVSVSGVWP